MGICVPYIVNIDTIFIIKMEKDAFIEIKTNGSVI